MEELKRRILSDAVVGEGDIIHVDMFLNHCMDINLMEHMGNALAKRFRGVRITKVLTAESSGIALAVCSTSSGRPGGLCEEVPDRVHRSGGLLGRNPLLLSGEVLYPAGL